MNAKKKARMFKKIIIGFILILDFTFLPFLIHIITALRNDSIANILLKLSFDKYTIYLTNCFKGELKNIFLLFQLLILAVCLGIWFYSDFLNSKQRTTALGTPSAAGSGEFGTARFMTDAEKKKTTKVWDSREELDRGGIILGADIMDGKEQIWIDDEDVHTLIIGTTRSGKSRRLILPTIWELAKSGESMVIGDPKGELCLHTEEYLKSKGYNVIKLNFRDPAKGNRWNMMDLINKAVKENDIARAMELTWDLTCALTKKPKGSKSGEPIWENGEQAALAGVVLLVTMLAPFEKQKHISSVFNLLTEYNEVQEDGSCRLIDIFKSLPMMHPAKTAFATVMASYPKTRSSFFTQTLSTLRIFADYNIMHMCSESDHELHNVGIEKTVVFLIIPDEKTTRYPLATLYLDQLYVSLVDLANKHGGRVPRRVNMLLDEFGNLPPIPDFDQKITVSAGRGIRYTIAIQDFAQVKKNYGDNAPTILGNCHNWIYLLTSDNDTAKRISERLGKYTVKTESSNASLQTKGHSVSAGTSLTGRPLIMPEELQRWDINNGVLVMRVKNYPAIFPLPDLSEYRANKEFGFTKNRNKNQEILKIRVESQKASEIMQPMIWLPGAQVIKQNTDYDTSDTLAMEENEVDTEDSLFLS